MYDIAIIGTGPAGLEAAITAKVRNKNNGNLKYTILTMGCQLNENDSEKRRSAGTE